MSESYTIQYGDSIIVDLRTVPLTGRVLDIGGGGEGVIGQLAPDQVVSIDPSREELEQAPAGPLKVVMRAENLTFTDASFTTATLFYTLMYIPKALFGRVLRECWRVLSPGGLLLIWDTEIQEPGPQAAEAYLVPVTALLPHRTIETGYGVRWDGAAQTAEEVVELCRSTGFSSVTLTRDGSSFLITAAR